MAAAGTSAALRGRPRSPASCSSLLRGKAHLRLLLLLPMPVCPRHALKSHHGYMTMSHKPSTSISCQRHGVFSPLHLPRLYRSPAARQLQQRPRSHRMSRTQPSTQRSRHLLSWLWPHWGQASAQLPHVCFSACLPQSSGAHPVHDLLAMHCCSWTDLSYCSASGSRVSQASKAVPLSCLHA